MISRKLLIKDSDGKPSSTVTAFIFGFIIVNVKFLLGGKYGLIPITGVEYGAALSALGGIYILRRTFPGKIGNKKEEGS